MSEGLLTCPHCDSEAHTPTNWGDPSRPIPRCRNPECLAEARSVEAWNRRPAVPAVAKLLAALKDEVLPALGGKWWAGQVKAFTLRAADVLRWREMIEAAIAEHEADKSSK